MNEKIKISLIATSSFGFGATSMAVFITWAFYSTMKDINKKTAVPYRRYKKSEDRSSSENQK